MRSKPKKRLGQNFLVNTKICKKIIESCCISKSETVIEIGPGRGELTELLWRQSKHLIAVELDRNLSGMLATRFKANPAVTIVNADFLKLNLEQYLDNSKKTKIIGNIPYYITTPIIEKIFSHADSISCAYLTVQKEFAARLCAQPGSKEYGSFTCFVRYYSNPKLLFNIKAGSFYPKPKIDSSLVCLDILEKPPVVVRSPEEFFSLIGNCFAQRRKTLKNNLKTIFPPPKLEAVFDALGLDKNIRAERLTLENFAALANF